MLEVVEKAIELGNEEAGVRESDDNSGQRVREYQAATTLGGSHWPWCAAFTAWCLRQAARATDTNVDYCYSASCDVVSEWARSADVLFESPRAGDIFLVYASPRDATHTGLVTGVDGADFSTVEGNTNLDGGHEGIGVFKRNRVNGDRYKFVRWANLCEPNAAPYTLTLGGKDYETKLIEGSTFVPVRTWGAALGFVVQWNDDKQLVILNGTEFPSQIALINGQGYAPLRKLANFSGLTLNVDEEKRVITVLRSPLDSA